MYYIVDRIEEGIVVLETPEETREEHSILDFPPELREGDYLLLKEGIWQIDSEVTKAAREKMIERMKRIKNPGGF